METRSSSISFYYKEGRIRLSYSALERLGKPKFIRFLLSVLENKIIIMGYELTDEPIKAKVILVDEKNRSKKEYLY